MLSSGYSTVQSNNLTDADQDTIWDLKAPSSAKFELRWVSIDTGLWGATVTLTGGSPQTITAPGKGAWAAAIVKK